MPPRLEPGGLAPIPAPNGVKNPVRLGKCLAVVDLMINLPSPLPPCHVVERRALRPPVGFDVPAVSTRRPELGVNQTLKCASPYPFSYPAPVCARLSLASRILHPWPPHTFPPARTFYSAWTRSRLLRPHNATELRLRRPGLATFSSPIHPRSTALRSQPRKRPFPAPSGSPLVCLSPTRAP